MSKAYEVMTQSLATVLPDDTVSHVASIMRDRDIEDVLIMEDGKLQGIVTDRDLALNALTDSFDPHHTPIRNFMSGNVITGSPDWSMSKVARTMAKNRIRRLPIVEDDQLVGIISLADLVRNADSRAIVTRSLKAVSTPPETSRSDGTLYRGALMGISIITITSTAVAILTWNHSGKELRKQMADSGFYLSDQQAVGVARDRVNDVASSKTARNLRQQVQANLKGLSNQLPRIEYKPPKRKSALLH
jgi:CBS domain-containing protein/gas vesicle protein